MMNLRAVFTFTWSISLLVTSLAGQTSALPSDLIVEYASNPLGIDERAPRFSWVVPGERRGTMQSAYRIRVARSPEALRDADTAIWDSGRVDSDQSINVAYRGPELEPHTRYHWTVRTWDNYGNASEAAQPEWFETAFLDPSGWQAKWIGDGRAPPARPEDHYEEIPNPLLRTEFSLAEPIERARLYISGLGYYEALLNGEKVGERVLDPGWTNYGERVLYSTYDVTELLNEGDNAIGVLLGNGWYNPLPLGLFRRFNLREALTIGQPKLIAELHVWHSDGSKRVITSDSSWRWDLGPFLKNNVYLGETYDARKEQPGWATPGFDAEGWKPVVVADPPGGRLTAQMAPPIRVTKIVQPVSVTQPEPGVHVFDLGQNFAGWIHLTLQGEAGTEVKMRYGELLYEDGRVNGMTTVAGHIKEIWNLSGGPGAPPTAYQEDHYIMKGGDEESFQQKFGFQAFRYVEIVGYLGELTKDSLVGLRLNSDLTDVGFFECSNELFNEIQKVTEWTMLSNVFSIQSDCPGREKLGYGGDIVTAAEAYIHNYDMANFYRKTVRDFAGDVRPNGGLPETGPYMGIDTQGFGEGSGPIGWQLAHPFVVQKLYQYYGDKRIVQEQYPIAKRALEFIREQAPDHYIERGIGDHVSVSEKEVPLTSTAFYYHFATLVAEFAEILGKTEDAQQYRELASDIADTFRERFFEEESGAFGSKNVQANQLFGLYYGLEGSSQARSKAVDRLVRDIMETQEGHLTTGIFGTMMLWDVLDREGLNEVAYTVANQRDYPGYGYMIENDATTLWENWDLPDQNSHNHPMFGSVSEWFYQSVLGIQPAANAVAIDHVLIRPSTVGDLTYARGSYDSVRGSIAVDWEKEEDAFSLELRLPANLVATVALPVADFPNPTVRERGTTIVENGDRASKGEGIEFVGANDARVLLKLGSGDYRFVVSGGN